jgi:hypothetical protein
MLPFHRKLPLPYHLFDLTGRQAERLGIQAGDLRQETLVKAAQQRTGLADFGHPNFRLGLEKLLESLEKDAHLRFYGRLVMRFLLINTLCQRLLFVDAQKNHPEIFRPLSQSPIVITGLHRSGTTFLHRLLALDQKNFGPNFWQLYRPFRLPGLFDLRKPRAWAELSILNPIFPRIKHKHRIRPFAAEESSWMMGLTLYSMVFWILAPVYSYLHWLWDQDFSEVYREYALLLAVLQKASPTQRLVVKAPEHMPHLDLLLGAIPDARIVQLQRDPTTCVVSLSSLFYSTHIALSECGNPRHLAESNRDLAATFMWANHHARKDPSVDRMVLDLDYEDLVSDPLAAVQKVYLHFGLEWCEEFGLRLKQFILNDKKQGRPVHHYTAAQFGFDEAELRAFFKER